MIDVNTSNWWRICPAPTLFWGTPILAVVLELRGGRGRLPDSVDGWAETLLFLYYAASRSAMAWYAGYKAFTGHEFVHEGPLSRSFEERTSSGHAFAFLPFAWPIFLLMNLCHFMARRSLGR